MLYSKEVKGNALEGGFTLVELLVGTVIALVVLGGLLVSFQSQYTEYKYQNKRIDSAQDLEFSIRFIADDLRLALHSSSVAAINPAETNGFTNGAAATTDLRFSVWEPTYDPDVDQRARRRYHYDATNETICYDRSVLVGVDNTVTGANACRVDSEVLRDVTFFKVFQDAVGVSNGVTPRGGFTAEGIPRALASWVVNDIASGTVTVPSYTILIEVAVDAGYKNGSFTDVLGVDQSPGVGDGRKRLWRFVRVHPRSAI